MTFSCVCLCNCAFTTLANFFKNFVTLQKDVADEPHTTLVTIYDDVNFYLRMPQIPFQDLAGNDNDILKWWRDNSSQFSNREKMARQFLAAPASSASAERLFSSAGKMHDDLKKSTSEETMESSLIVNMNYPSA